MKFLFLGLLLVQSNYTTAGEYTCDLNGQTCPEGYRCPIRWSDGPYNCARFTTQKGVSVISFQDAEVAGLNKAYMFCRDNGFNYAKIIFAPNNTIETHYTPHYGDEGHPHKRFVSVGIFDCL